MLLFNKKQRKMNLKGHYDALKDTPIPSEKSQFKDEIIKGCAITKQTFYRWLNNPKQIPALAQEKISEIISKSVSNA